MKNILIRLIVAAYLLVANHSLFADGLIGIGEDSGSIWLSDD